MREIKFRAYCSLTKSMINDYCVLKENEFIGYDMTNNTHYIESVMQFTGLYDKNGKEIYEGDIVAFGNAIGLEDDYGVIEYKSSRYSFYIENEKTGLWEELFNISCAFLEIIGNIHENPELLEQK